MLGLQRCGYRKLHRICTSSSCSCQIRTRTAEDLHIRKRKGIGGRGKLARFRVQSSKSGRRKRSAVSWLCWLPTSSTSNAPKWMVQTKQVNACRDKIPVCWLGQVLQSATLARDLQACPLLYPAQFIYTAGEGLPVEREKTEGTVDPYACMQA